VSDEQFVTKKQSCGSASHTWTIVAQHQYHLQKLSSSTMNTLYNFIVEALVNQQHL
jgi:hypothetical protein